MELFFLDSVILIVVNGNFWPFSWLFSPRCGQMASKSKKNPLFLATPVGSVSCEISFSARRRLKLWTRSSMTEERLCGLAVTLIPRGTNYMPTPKDIYERKPN